MFVPRRDHPHLIHFLHMKTPDDKISLEERTIQAKLRPVRISTEGVLNDLRRGLRTREFLAKYGLSLVQFEELLKKLIRLNLFTKDEFKAWKSRKVQPEPADEPGPEPAPDPPAAAESPMEEDNVETYIISEPEKNNSWALQLFKTDRDRIRGAKFKVNLHGKKYSFTVEELLFRGQVEMLTSAAPRKEISKNKREEALALITKHGWAAYLEQRAFSANFDEDKPQKARLVLLHCKNETFLAALHTPAPAINLYVGSSLENIRDRLSKSVDTSQL